MEIAVLSANVRALCNWLSLKKEDWIARKLNAMAHGPYLGRLSVRHLANISRSTCPCRLILESSLFEDTKELFCH